ncbi:hypothetical protein EG68_08356 [Paragonimus skrjabini miyazakii]|uniref:Uncharacterized protein n=1 Tax=Paragonimus skrjabini miyazakii TaxID=59628 RepID=A0A8S9YMK6_9TREM|nr:hypothetical protein EG68_08356 [Paragonimus skrjabini miyazakii]
MEESGGEFCPLCIKRGSLHRLSAVITSAGRLKNLCSSPTCSYPFCGYKSLADSISIPDFPTSHADTQSLDDFLAEILGDAVGTHPPVNSEPTYPTSQRCKSSNIETAAALDQIKTGTGPCALNDISPLSPYSGSTSECPTSVPSKNCLLPRYLADSIKRVTTDHNSNRYGCTKSEMFSKLYARSLTGGSRDSGISVSSCSASPNSPSVGYEEYKKQHRPLTTDDDNCTSARMFSTSGSMSLLDHMIKVQQERL